MSLNLTNFERAEYTDASSAPVDADLPNAPATPDPALFTRAILFGLGGAAAGAIIDGLFIGITHINLGYLALLIAWLVAKAMTTGSNGQGGRNYQIAALVLTYLSVSAAHSGLLWWQVRQEGTPVPLTAHNLFVLARYGIESPFLRFQDAGASAILGLFILFIGLRAAWRMTSGDPGAVRHPFAR
jgi:hypothetical protein